MTNRNRNRGLSRARRESSEVAPAGFSLQEKGEGEASFSFDLSQVPPPEKSFSADAVAVKYRSEYHHAYVFFVAGDAVLEKPRAYVRVRFPLTALRSFSGFEASFFSRLDAFVQAMGHSDIWRVNVEDLADVPTASTTGLEGTFVSISHHGEAGLCDIYALPADFVLRARANRPWTFDTSLRVTLPTVVIHQMLLELRPIIDRKAS